MRLLFWSSLSALLFLDLEQQPIQVALWHHVPLVPVFLVMCVVVPPKEPPIQVVFLHHVPLVAVFLVIRVVPRDEPLIQVVL
jgi:hypothetical protein